MPTVTIPTTQNVRIDYELAATGLRIGAFLLDLLIFGLGYAVVMLLVLRGILAGTDFDEVGAIVALGSIFSFLAYYFLLETFAHGRTLGKRLLGLRVVRLDGRDPTPADFLARAVFLLPDVLFSAGVPAVVLVASGRYKQRIGDLVAGTAVIQAGPGTDYRIADIAGISTRATHQPRFPGVQRYTNADMLILKQTLLRAARYDNAAHHLAVSRLADRVLDDLELDGAEISLTPHAFLEAVLLDYIVLTR